MANTRSTDRGWLASLRRWLANLIRGANRPRKSKGRRGDRLQGTDRPTKTNAGSQERLGVTVPVISPEVGLYPTKLIWRDEFDGDLSQWSQDTFVDDPQHRTGYEHLELDGSINMDLDYQKVPGRWATLMDKYRDKVQFIRDSKLVMKGFAVKEKNPYRKNFKAPDGRLMPYGDWKFYTAWLRVPDLLEPGTILDVRVNLEKQMMGGVRWSLWGMPKKDAYDENVADVEVDGPEIENPQRHDSDYGHIALMKVVGGLAGDTPNADRDLRDFDINVRRGYHNFTWIWEHNGTLIWLCDGKEINRETRSVTAGLDLILSSEWSSGCKDPENETIAAHELTMDGPHQPWNAGLTARSAIDDIDLIDEHEVLVDYVRVYRIAA